MKKILLVLTSFNLLIFQGCEKGETNLFERDYYYYTFNFDKISLRLKGSELYVAFNKDTVSKEEATTFLSNYDYLTEFLTTNNTTNFNKFHVKINPEDTLLLEEILLTLNQDPNIDFANPVFTLSSPISPSFMILNNEIICDPYTNDASITELFSGYNLAIIKSEPESFYYLLQVRDFKTGFETLDIANRLYQSKKFNYCHPNFIAPIVFGK
jgi:hypothetical protein